MIFFKDRYEILLDTWTLVRIEKDDRKTGSGFEFFWGFVWTLQTKKN